MDTASADPAESLRQARRVMEGLMRNAPVGIALTRERRILRYNPRMAEMFGYGAEEAVGQPASIVYLSEEQYAETGRIAGPLLAAGKPFRTEQFLRRKDGSRLWVSQIGYVQDPEHPAAGTIWIFEDRSEALRAEQSLRAAKERAEAASGAKSRFLARMSHELRTPLNAVLGFTQLLQMDPGLSPRQARALDTIHQSGQQLLNLINDVLDLARIEAGRLELAPAPLTLMPFLQSLLEQVGVQAQARGLALGLRCTSSLPQQVMADEQRLRQVLLNLLGNALKFTRCGRVELRVGAVPQDDAHLRLRFEVEDSGPGIAAEDLAKIFVPFEQLGDSAQRAGGSGLGLAISRELVQKLGGDIQVRSVPGQGSVFGFELPLAPVEAQQPAAAAPQRITGYEGRRRRVLVVDDVAVNRALLHEFLERLGFEVTQAADGQQALHEAQARWPDLVLMDSVMPVMDGPEATRRLRRTPGLAQVPVISLSASAVAAEQGAGLAAGANAFLPKPVVFDDLLRAIGELLRLQWIVS